MYEITCDREIGQWRCKHIVEEIIDFIEINGCINEREFLKRVCPNMKTAPNDTSRGWTSHQIIDGPGIFQAYDRDLDRVKIQLPDPVNFTETEKFDIVSRPSHYTAGRKYEPRKVISDWGLNFNLGNAVKYISRAGRKGDKIEDLRKAIQYIEFEIDDLENKEEER